MLRIWQLQEAKNKLSEVVEEAIKEGPQVITKRGIEAAVLLSYEDYRKLIVTQKTLTAFFRESPLASVELDLDRDKSLARQEPSL